MSSASRPVVLCLCLVASLAGGTGIAGAQDAPKGGGAAQAPQAQPGPGQSDPEKPAEGAKAGENGETSPETPEQRQQLLTTLQGHLVSAADAETATRIAASIERLWLYSGSPTTDLLMERAGQAFTNDDLVLAQTVLDAVVELQPDFAEGWNRRAYLHYQRSDTKRALGDIRRALALEPNHFKAIEGLGNILRDSGEKKGALQAYERLLQIYPLAEGAKQAVEELKREVEGQGI